MTTTSFTPFYPQTPQKSKLGEGWPWCLDLPKTPHKAPAQGSPKSKSTPKKTPMKTPKKTPGHDRFIPSMTELGLEMGHFNLLKEAEKSPSDYKDALADSLFEGKMKGKILTFKDKAPAPKGTSSLHALYSHNHYTEKPKTAVRHIPHAPERVLDAPNFRDDFYLNLIDWGSKNLAIGLDNHVWLWNLETATPQDLFNLEEDGLTSVAWTNSSDHIAIGTESGDVQLWDVRAEKRVRILKGHSGRVGSLSWNNSTLTSASRDATIVNHDVRQAQHIYAVLSGHTGEVCGLKWSPDGTQLASGANDNLINIWDASIDSAPRCVFNDHQAAVKALAWCPWEPNLLASGGGTADRCIRFWNTGTGALLNTIDTNSQVCSILWSKHSKELVSAHGYSQNQLSVWRYPSMKKVADLTGHSSRVLNMSMSPDGEYVCSVAGDETMRFWKLFEKPSFTVKKDYKKAVSMSAVTTIR